LADKEHRLNCDYIAGAGLKHQIVMLKSALKRFFDDLVVAMIFALILERSFPGIAILQVTQLQHLHHAFIELDCMATGHGNGVGSVEKAVYARKVLRGVILSEGKKL
jgi:hypothetical protein